MTIVADQLTDSMGRMFYIWICILRSTLYAYGLSSSKIILEKNSNAISIVKILGYKGNEIMRLYVAATAIVVFISICYKCSTVRFYNRISVESNYGDIPWDGFCI